jgi:hypothetical protein
MQHLSEKAKGKQRADAIPVDVFNNNGGPIPPRQLMVRFTEGVQDLVIQVAEDDSVRDAKAKVCPRLLVSLLSCPIVSCMHPICLIYTVRSEKRAPNSSTVACASSTPDGSSPTGRNYHLGLVRLKSASSAPRQKSKTKSTHRYCLRLPRCPLAAPQPRFPQPCHGFIAP